MVLPIAGAALIAAPGRRPDFGNTEGDLLARWERVQQRFGAELPIKSAYRTPDANKNAGGAKRSQHMLGKAIDVDVSSLPIKERLRLMRIASDEGMGGLGVYNNSLHFDIGPRRAWGPSYKFASLPGWAKDTIAVHMRGGWNSVPKSTETTESGAPADFRGVPRETLERDYASTKTSPDFTSVPRNVLENVYAKVGPGPDASGLNRLEGGIVNLATADRGDAGNVRLAAAEGGFTREEIEAELRRRGALPPPAETKEAAPTAAPTAGQFTREEIEAELRRRGALPPPPPAETVSAPDAKPGITPETPPLAPTDLIPPVGGVGALLHGLKLALPDNYKHLVDEAIRGAGFGWTDQAVGAAGAVTAGVGETATTITDIKRELFEKGVDVNSPEGRKMVADLYQQRRDNRSVGDRATAMAAGDRAASAAARNQEMARGESVKVFGYDITPGDVANFAGSTAAAAPVAGALVGKAGAAAAPKWAAVAKTAAGAAEGAAIGGVMSAGEADDGNRMQAGVVGAVGGAIIGGVLTRAGISYERYLAAKAARKAATTVDKVKAAAGQMYDEAERLGAVYDPAAARTLSDDLERIVVDEVLDETEPTYRAIKGIKTIIDTAEKNGKPIEMTHIKRMKQVIRRKMDQTRPGGEEARLLRRVRDAVEDFAIDDANMLAFGTNGAGKTAAQVRKEADILWRNAKTAEDLQQKLEKAALQTMATGSGGNINNKIRQVFTKIAGDPKQMRRYTPAEQEAIRAVVDQGFSSAALRQIGKLSMSGNGLIQALQLYAAVNTGGLSALTIPVATAAKYAADAKTTKLAQNVITVILSGGNVPAASLRQLSGAERRAVSSAIARVLTANNAETVGEKVIPSLATP